MKISIITATYNSAATIEDTIKSVLCQDYTDWEHIIVDGMSNDNTKDVVFRYEKEYHGRLKFISGKDGGLYDAMNKGIQMASGDVIGILNSDDFFTSSNILSQVIANIEGVDAVYGDIHFVSPENLNTCVRYYSSKYFQPWHMRFGFMPAHPSFYCRKSLYEDIAMYDTNLKSGADFDLLLKMFCINKIKAKYLPLNFVTMRTGGISTSGWVSYKRTISDQLSALKNNGIYSNLLFILVKYAYKYVELQWQKVRGIALD